MDKQEIFNKVFLGLKSQEFRQSVNEHNVCQYRGEDGLKCAVGHLIPDEIYIKEWDEHTTLADSLPPDVYDSMGIRADFGASVDFLMELQNIHDNYDVPERMEENYRQFALAQGLTVPE